MPVVPAGVHFAHVRGFVFDFVLFLYGKGVHIRAKGYGCRVLRRFAAAKECAKAARAHLYDFAGQGFQMILYVFRRFWQLTVKFGYAMKVAPKERKL
jgi:hypothetical protein